MREATEDSRPIREYAWVPVIRLHLDILWRERRRVSPCRWHVLNGMRRSETTPCDVAEVRKKCRCNRYDNVLMTRWIFLNRGSLTSPVLKKKKKEKCTINSPRHRETRQFCRLVLAILTESTVCKQNHPARWTIAFTHADVILFMRNCFYTVLI